MHAASAGGDRQELHERIRRHAHAAARRMKDGEAGDLVERIAADDAFPIGRDEILGLIDPARFVGRAPDQVDRFLAERVDPVLERLARAAHERLGPPEVRV